MTLGGGRLWRWGDLAMPEDRKKSGPGAGGAGGSGSGGRGGRDAVDARGGSFIDITECFDTKG